MATFFNFSNPELMVIVPPNSEAINDAQRFGVEERSVGSYYVSNKSKQVISFLSGFKGQYLIDVAWSYKSCLTLYESLISNCNSFYRNGLEKLKSTLAIIKANIDSQREDALFISPDEVALTESMKYLRISGQSPYMKYFKEMILGDVIEIVIKRVTQSLYVIYLRPHKDVENWVSSYDLFNRWIKENTVK
jgi:hypothetical protein